MLATTVESTTLAAVSYDVPNHRLCLEFRNRQVYCYSCVPPAVYRALIAAPSKGAYFNRYIRGRFPFRKQADAQLDQPALST